MRAIATGFDERFLVEAAQRDPSQFAQLYEINFDRIYAFVAARVRDRSEAEDITAEVFRQALANLRQFHWRGVPIRAWLFRIAANVLRDRWRDPATQRELQDEAVDEAAHDPGIERRALIAQMLERLPTDQQTVLQRRFFEGRSIAEIARELHRSEGAIKQLQFRALQTLREQMRSHHE